MSRYAHHHHQNRPPIVVHDHDVLSGRGVNIAQHPGNERFRTLVTTRADENYCQMYSASEKRAVAEEIIKHIQALDPPGRFLKRDGRGQVSRGLNGPWEQLSDREAIKKTCQALRDCNRNDRQGYAVGVAAPTDVVQSAEKRMQSGLTGKQQAAAAAAASAAAANAAAAHKRGRDQFDAPGVAMGAPQAGGRVSPSVENAAEWLKKQRTEEGAGGVPVVAASAAHDAFGAHHHLPPPPAEHSHEHPHAYHHDPNGTPLGMNGGAAAAWSGNGQVVPPAPAPGYPPIAPPPPMENIPGEDSINLTEL